MRRSTLSATVSCRQATAILGILVAASPQGARPRYGAEMLDCAAFREDVRSEIRNESGTVMREERAGRGGVIVLRAARGDSGIELTGWYDSLEVWREGPEGRTAPDAEGLLGGRWRGVLTPAGRYHSAQLPFVPDDVAEIADLRGVMGDLFPLLEIDTVRDGSFRRLSDEAGVQRYGWRIKFRADTSGVVDDTLVVPMRREFHEEGTLSWDRQKGPIRWERTITVTGRIEKEGPIRRPIRSTVIQRLRVTRLAARACG
jgi:hypothetical protein